MQRLLSCFEHCKYVVSVSLYLLDSINCLIKSTVRLAKRASKRG